VRCERDPEPLEDGRRARFERIAVETPEGIFEIGVLELQSVDFFPARTLEETRGSVEKSDGGPSLLCRFDGREQLVATRGQRFSSVVAALLLLPGSAVFRGSGGRQCARRGFRLRYDRVGIEMIVATPFEVLREPCIQCEPPWPSTPPAPPVPCGQVLDGPVVTPSPPGLQRQTPSAQLQSCPTKK